MAITQEEIENLLNKNRKSILCSHKEDLLKLRHEGVTLSCIKIWLKENKNIDTSTENIRQFCLRYANNIETVKPEKIINKNEKQKLFENIGRKES